jgi:mono/diheme cytochrome c family protein
MVAFTGQMITERKSKNSPVSYSFRTPHTKAVLLGACVVLLAVLSATAQQPPRPQRKGDKAAGPTVPASQAEVTRGKYIVEKVAMCPQCHTPRNGDGSLDHAHELEGAPEFFQSPHPDQNWPLKAPRIGGDPPANDQDMIKLLTTGIWTDGKPLRLPMMPFRMSEADAKAVLAYLKTVKQQH